MSELESLYRVLVDQGLYTKSFDEFKQQYSDDQYKKKVFDVVKEKKLYTKEFSDFTDKYSEKKNDGFTLGETDMDLPQKEVSSDTPKPEKQEIDTEEGFQAKDYLGEFLGGAIDAGVRQGKTAEETMELIYKGDKISDEEIQSYINAVKKMEQDGPSEDMIEFQRIAEENGGGFGGFIAALGTEGVGANAATEVALTSFSGMISAAIDAKEETALGVGAGAALGAAAGATALPFAPVTAPAGAISGSLAGLFGASGGLLETSMSYTEFLKEELGDKDFNIENIREVLKNEEVKDRIRNKALTRGGIIGLVDAMSAGIAGSVAKGVGKTIGKVSTKLGKAAKATAQITSSGIVEGVGGGTGEALARLAVGQEMDATEIGFEAIGGAPKGAITGPIGILRATGDSKPSFKINGETVPKGTAERVINTSTPEDLTKIKIEVKNDDFLETKLNDKKERHNVSEQLPDGILDANREEVIDLEIERKKLENKKSVSAKQRIKELDAEIAEKSKKIVEETVEEASTTTEETKVSESEIDELLSEIERVENQGTLEENIGEKAYMDGKEGMIKIDDENANTIVFESNDEIINLGRLDLNGKDLIASKDISLMPPEGVDVTKSNESSDVISLDGKEYKFIGRSRDKKGKAVVKLKEAKSGLIKRFIRAKAERILKDQSLKKPKKRIDVLNVKKKTDPMMTQKSYESKALEEVIELERQANEDLSVFEQELLDVAVKQTENKDLIQVGENIFQVTQKPNGEVSVSQMREDGKLVPVFDSKKRSDAAEKFKKDKSNKEKALIEDAENKINEYRQEQEDKIINFLDKAIKETSSQGRAFDASLGLPMFVVNSSLKIIKASYKAGKALSQAIQDGIIHLRKQGYGVNELEYKKYVLNNLKDSNKKPKIQVDEESKITKDQQDLEVKQKVEEQTEVVEEKKTDSDDIVNEIGVALFVNKISNALKGVQSFVKKKRLKHFSAKGLIPDIIYRQREKRNSLVRQYVTKINRTFKDVRRILKTVPKDKRDSVMQDFDLVLKGKKKSVDSSLPLEMAAVVARMRSEIDGLSNMLMESGYYDSSNEISKSREEGLNSILKNIGSYVNRSYRIFSDPNWSRLVSDEVKENARKFFRREAIKNNKSVSEQEIEQKINEILDKAEENKFIVAGKDGKISKDILRRRKDIPPEIRALMGEVENPLENYQNTILKQAQLLFNYQYQRKIAEAGENTFFTKNRTDKNTKQIAKEGNESYPELAGLWTTPEIAETFKKPNPMPDWMDTFVKVNGTIKWLKTVGSVATHVKNIIGNHGFVMMNGHLNPKEFFKAGQNVWAEFTGMTNDQQKKYFDNLVALGIVKQSATLGDIRTAFTDKSFEEAYEKSLTDQARSVAKNKEGLANNLKYIQSLFKASKTGKASKRLVDFLNDAYQTEDDFFKVVAYEIEKSRYADALFEKDKSQLTEDQSKKVDKVVAEIVKNTYPTYDRVPPLIKKLGRAPFLGAFVSFKAESIRTAVNTYALAIREGKSKNPKIATLGAKRLMAAGLYTSVKLAIASQFAMAVRSFITGGDGDESQEYNDLKRFLPEWSKNSIISMSSKEPGKYTYTDFTANDPHAFMSELVVAGRDEKDIFPSVIEKLTALGKPFLGKDLIFGFGTEAFKIAQSERFSTEEKMEKIMTEFYKLMEPGTVSSLRRIGNAAIKEGGDRALKELRGFTGFKPVDVDIEKQYGYKAFDYKKQKDQYKSTYNRVRYNKESTEEDLSVAYDQINTSYKQMIKNLQEDTSAALRLGADEYNLKKQLKNSNFNKRDIMYIFTDWDDYEYIPTQMSN